MRQQAGASLQTDSLTSRFVRTSDPLLQHFVFDLPESWWSRVYEYAWAKDFCGPDDVVLDAASGVEHPFKFFARDVCRDVYACDLDDRILSPPEIVNAVGNHFGREAAADFPERYLTEVHYEKSSLTKLPYEDRQFDRIFCISVLEHLEDKANRWPWLARLGPLTQLMAADIRHSLREFKRTLKDDGFIVLTFDYPRINLTYFQRLVSELGLEFAGPVDFTLPKDAIHNREKGLHCVRAVLKKRGA